jgi:hypothetical protein
MLAHGRVERKLAEHRLREGNVLGQSSSNSVRAQRGTDENAWPDVSDFYQMVRDEENTTSSNDFAMKA